MKELKLIIAVIGGAIASFLGGFDLLIQTMFIFVILDYITGVTKAIFEHKLSSVVGFKGITKKILIFLLIGVAFQVDKVMGTTELRNMVIVFYLANEGLSILENCVCLGLPIPESLKKILEAMTKED